MPSPRLGMVAALVLFAAGPLRSEAPGGEPSGLLPNPTVAMCQAGYARLEITPPPGCALVGYPFAHRHAPTGPAGVLDPLEVRALAVSAGQEPPWLLLTLDLCVLETPVADFYRARLAEDLALSEERIWLACSHTHSGPLAQVREAWDRPGAADHPRLRDDWGEAELAYGDQLLTALRSAAARALALRFPVAVSSRAAAAELGYRRRTTAGGVPRICWNPQEYPDRPPQPTADPLLTVVSLRQTNGPRHYVLLGAGVHPVCLGKTSPVVSADWPGEARRAVEAALPGAQALFVQGASGEIHPWVATQETPEGMRLVGQAAGSMAALLAQATVPAGRSQVVVREETVTLGGARLRLGAARVGDITFLAAPVELFASLAADLRRRIPGPVVFCTLTNGWEAYWPDRAAFAEGGYEADIARACGRQPGDGEALVEALAALALRLPDPL